MSQADRILLRSSPTEDTTPEMGIILGHALAMDFRRVVVARDLMRSSSMMKEALVSGLLSSGADVIDIGVASGPAVALAASKGDCAVYVTEYRGYGMISGYILINRDGSLFRKEQIRHLQKVFVDPPELPASGNMGHVLHYASAVEEYNDRILAKAPGCSECSAILDCGCGPVSASAPQILNARGAGLLTINAQSDLDFKSESVDELGLNISDIRNLLEACPGSIGISMNKAGTMMTLLDEKGNVFTPEQLLAIVVMYLRPASLVVPLDMSSLVRDAFLGRLGGITPGIPVEKAEESGLVMTSKDIGAVCSAVSAGAEMGYYEGGIIFGDTSLMPDGIRTAAAVAAIAGTTSVNRLLESFPRYRRDSKEVECTGNPDAFVRAIEDSVSDLNGTVTTAGEAWRVDLEEGWIVIGLRRGQNPSVTIDAESEDRAYLVGLMEVAGDLVSKCLKAQ